MTNETYHNSIEYAFDLLEHFYKLHENMILCVGKENIKIYIPTEIFSLLKHIDTNGKTVFPETFHGIKLAVYTGSTIIFALKEDKR